MIEKLTIALFLSVLVAPVFSQSSSLADELKSAYDNFNYSALDSLLEKAFEQPQKYPADVQVEIYRYGAFQRIQNDDSEVARSYFRQMLDIDPTIELDRLTTSPKILLVFQQAKLDYAVAIQQRLSAIEAAMAFEKENRPWRSLVFPGWEQYRRGYKIKGIVWATMGVISITGTGQSILNTQTRFDEYINETDRALLESRYNTYNDSYQRQFYWGYALASVWLSSHIDAIFFSQIKDESISIQPNLSTSSVGLTIRF
ncbi:MAG: hypothetical protein ACRBF0_22300 [Calditrichia bacterium]